MVSISGALMSKKEVLEPFLALILRDDLLSWHVSKASVNRTEEQQKAVRIANSCGSVVAVNTVRVSCFYLDTLYSSFSLCFVPGFCDVY